MAEQFIDATNLKAGRLASYAAKQALLGDKIVIVNAEKSIITGKKENALNRHKKRKELGQPTKGPFFPRTSDRMLRRIVRGMLPHRQQKGKEAFQRVMCYIGVPEEFKNKKFETLPLAQLSKTKSVKTITLGELSKLIK